MKAEHLPGGGVAVLVAGAVRMEAVDREVLAAPLPEMGHVRWRREVDEDGRCDARLRPRTPSTQRGSATPSPRHRAAETAARARGPEVPAKRCGRRAGRARAARCRNRRRADAAACRQRRHCRRRAAAPDRSTGRPPDTPADLRDRAGDARAGDGYVDDVGVRIVGSEQPGDGLLGPRRTDAHAGAVAEDQHHRALR